MYLMPLRANGEVWAISGPAFTVLLYFPGSTIFCFLRCTVILFQTRLLFELSVCFTVGELSLLTRSFSGPYPETQAKPRVPLKEWVLV